MGMNASAKKLAVLVLPIAVFATAISIATAQTAAPGNVVQRQDGMKAMANAAKSINAMFKDTLPYDARAFKAAAETIRVHSGAALSALFDGSGTTAMVQADPADRACCDHRRSSDSDRSDLSGSGNLAAVRVDLLDTVDRARHPGDLSGTSHMKKFRDVKYCIPTSADADLTETANASFNSQAVHMASALRALAHSARLMLVSKLMDSECSVTELELQLLIHQPTLSQQLTVLRHAKVVETRREGKKVFYRLGAGKAVQLVREISRIFCS